MSVAGHLVLQWVRYRSWGAYLVAHSAKSLVWHSSGLLFAFFLTETCRLPAREMGGVIALSLLVSAATDATLGASWQKHNRSPRELGALQAIGAAFAALFFVAFCSLPFVTPMLRLPVAAVLLIGFRLSFATLDVSQNAMIAILARDPKAQAKLLAARNVCSGFASLLVVLVAIPMLLSGADRAMRHLCWASAVGCAVVLAGLILGRSGSLRRAERALDAPSQKPPAPLCLTLTVAGIFVAASTLFRSLEPYAVAYSGFGPGILVWASLGAIACQPVWVFAGRRMSRAQAALLASGIAAAGALTLAISPPPHALGGVLAGLGFGIGSGGLWLMLWMTAVRTNALRRTARLSAVSKAAQAMAALALGQMLHGSSYRLATTGSSSVPSLAMIGTLLVIALCGVVLAVLEWRFSRTTLDAGPTKRRPMVPRGPASALRPPASSSAHGRHAVPAE